jgi:hypothetical protein
MILLNRISLDCQTPLLRAAADNTRRRVFGMLSPL